MSSLETLKSELLTQKTEIENKGGVVSVANTNPSPAEITSGIKSIYIPDLTASTATESDVIVGKTFYSGDRYLKYGTYTPVDTSQATATAEDVLLGKTFYAGDETLKTGTNVGEDYRYVYEYNLNVKETEKQIRYAIPSTLTVLRSYMFYQNKHNITIDFHSDITALANYAFAYTSNFTFNNFPELTKISTIPPFCFCETKRTGISLETLPPNIKKIEERSFKDAVLEGTTINVPDSVTSLGSYIFYNTTQIYHKALNISANSKLQQLGVATLENCIFDCDFAPPVTVTDTPSKFNYNGSFNNIILPKKFSSLYANCFGAASTTSLDSIRLKTIEFKNPNAPTIFYETSISQQAKENGLKIYVPDESIDAYKAKLTGFTDYIYPVSQKE